MNLTSEQEMIKEDAQASQKENKQVAALITMTQGNFLNESAYSLYHPYHSEMLFRRSTDK